MTFSQTVVISFRVKLKRHRSMSHRPLLSDSLADRDDRRKRINEERVKSKHQTGKHTAMKTTKSNGMVARKWQDDSGGISDS